METCRIDRIGLAAQDWLVPAPEKIVVTSAKQESEDGREEGSWMSEHLPAEEEETRTCLPRIDEARIDETSECLTIGVPHHRSLTADHRSTSPSECLNHRRAPPSECLNHRNTLTIGVPHHRYASPSECLNHRSASTSEYLNHRSASTSEFDSRPSEYLSQTIAIGVPKPVRRTMPTLDYHRYQSASTIPSLSEFDRSLLSEFDSKLSECLSQTIAIGVPQPVRRTMPTLDYHRYQNASTTSSLSECLNHIVTRVPQSYQSASIMSPLSAYLNHIIAIGVPQLRPSQIHCCHKKGQHIIQLQHGHYIDIEPNSFRSGDDWPD